MQQDVTSSQILHSHMTIQLLHDIRRTCILLNSPSHAPGENRSPICRHEMDLLVPEVNYNCYHQTQTCQDSVWPTQPPSIKTRTILGNNTQQRHYCTSQNFYAFLLTEAPELLLSSHPFSQEITSVSFLFIYRYASQHIGCLSQARINWQGCAKKGIQHKNGVMKRWVADQFGWSGAQPPDCR